VRIKIPLTGTLLTLNPAIGADDDPVRVIGLDLGDVAWRAVAWEWDQDLVEVELDAAPRRVGRCEDDGTPIPDETPATHKARRAQALAHVRELLLGHTIGELYELAGDPRLKKPFKGGAPPEG